MAKVQRGRGRELSVVNVLGRPVPIVGEYLSYLSARGCSPNTVRAYAYDLAHLWSFLDREQLVWNKMTSERAVDFLLFLRRETSRRRGSPRSLVLMTHDRKTMRSRLSPASVNRALAATSSFYEWAVLSGRLRGTNPISRTSERASFRVADRHRPFLQGIARKPVSARILRVKTVRRLPRPLAADQIERLFAVLRCARDVALLRLMLDGGGRLKFSATATSRNGSSACWPISVNHSRRSDELPTSTRGRPGGPSYGLRGRAGYDFAPLDRCPDKN